MEAKHLNLTLLREKWAVGGVERDEPVPLRIQLKHHGGSAEDPMGVPMASPQTTSTFPKAHTARAASAMAASSSGRRGGRRRRRLHALQRKQGRRGERERMGGRV